MSSERDCDTRPKERQPVRDGTANCSCEDFLQRSQENYRQLIEDINDIIYTIDLQNVITYISPVVERIIGYRPEECIGRPFDQFIHPDDLPAVKEHNQKTLADAQGEYEFRVLTKDGGVCHVRTSSRTQYRNGELVGVTGVISDITRQKLAEEALGKSEERYQLLAENIQDVIWIVKNMHFAYVSSAVTNQWGYTVDEVIGRPIASFVTPSSFEIIQKQLMEASVPEAGDELLVLPYEIEMVCKDGTHIWTEAMISIIRDRKGLPTAIQGISRDITMRKIVEDALQENLNLMQILTDSIPNPIFHTDMQGRLNGCNKAFEAILGVTKGEIIGGALADVLPCDPVFRTMSQFPEHPDTSLREDLADVPYADGTRHDIILSKTLFANALGERMGMVGVLFDITDQKRQENLLKTALQESHQRQAEISALLGAAHAVLESKTFQAAARPIFEHCLSLIRAAGGYVVVTDEESGRDITVYAHDDVPFDTMIRQACSFAPEVPGFQNGLSAADAPGAVRSLENVLTTPIMVTGKPQGLLVYCNKPGGFREDDLRLATAFSEFAAVALLNDRTRRSLEVSEKRFRSVAQTANDAVVTTERDGTIVFWNIMAERLFGYQASEALGQNVSRMMPKRFREGLSHEIRKISLPMEQISDSQDAVVGRTAEMVGLRKNGAEFPIEVSLSTWESEGHQFFTAIIRDITEHKHLESSLRQETEELKKARTELQQAYTELQNTQAHILQQEKMASIGQLAAGVAHEINNPMGFISSNLGSLQKYLDKLTGFMDAQSEIARASADEHLVADLEQKRKTLKIDYILDDVHELIKESLEGAERVKKIVQDLKSFSRVDEADFKHADINECLESTINIVWNELKYKATLEKDYGEIPLTKCYPQQINQVFMNLLVNAAHAIEKQGVIRVRTWQEDDSILASIADTGGGIPPEIVNRIFEPFFTTKEVGKGTGLGLSITYDIIKKHGGEITVQSEVGVGSTFTLRIPIVEGK